jgi:LPS-assembly lipoprotein
MSRALPHAAASSRLPRMIRILLASMLALALTACGFHLRNALQLPADLGPVKVVAPDPYSPLAESLADALLRAGATPADPSAKNVAVLRIRSERWGNLPISIDQFGRAQEYTLRYAVVFDLMDAAGRAVIPTQAVELSRDYVSSPTQLIGSESEREILAAELRREMSGAILRRVDAASRAPLPAAEPAPVDAPETPAAAPAAP